MVDETPASSDLSRTAWWVREVVAFSLWAFAGVKLFVFDIDSYLIGRFAPQLQWLLDYKAFVILALVSLFWIFAKRSVFQRVVGYFLGYPLILVFWRCPVWLARRWPLVIVFAPAVHRGVSTFRSTFLLYTVGALSALGALKASGPFLLLAIVGLAAFLCTHLKRALRKAYSSSVFVTLSGFVRQFRVSIEKGSFDPNSDTSKMTLEQKEAHSKQNPLAGFYMFRTLAEVVAENVSMVGRKRKYDVYLLCSFLYTTLVTTVVFGFAYVAVFRRDPMAFEAPLDSDFWSFLGYSMGIITTSSVTQIQAISSLAQFVAYLEVGCSVVLLTILVFTILTAAREAFRADVEEFSTELRLIAVAFETRAAQLFQLKGEDLEIVLLVSNAQLVNQVRRWRGLPELSLPPTDTPES